ncbi:MAG: hypothetical protein RKR03_07110, partial [Candidatus Competibacter sp.]|nr:hypothetical protein [Candidatus Competibacter sp.]
NSRIGLILNVRISIRKTITMCGIGGIVARHPVPAAWARGMNAAQFHRGPDGAGVWASPDDRVQLAHRRLAILDRSARGAQPMTDGSGRYVITGNGELDQSPRIG